MTVMIRRTEFLLTFFIFMHSVLTDIRVVDLTHVQGESTVYWPGNPPFNFTILFRNRTTGGYWYESNKFGTAEHGGTHLDAPSHFAEGSWRTHHIPMERLSGPGVIINVKSKAKSNPDYRVTVSDLQEWEKSYGKIPQKSVVIMNSGWSDFYPNRTLVFNSTTPDDPATFHFPGWHEDTVTWLVNKRHINVVGVDTPSNDYGQSKSFPVHVILGKANIPGVENVAFLDRIPQSGTMIFVAAIKLENGSGGPSRVFATITDSDDNNSTNVSTTHVFSVRYLSILVLLAFTIIL